MPPIVSVVGRTNSGKTTLIEKLIPALARRGYRVATIKHHHYGDFEADHPGKDSWRHARAGAVATALAGARRLAVFQRLETELDPEAIGRLFASRPDLILTEGYTGRALSQDRGPADRAAGRPALPEGRPTHRARHRRRLGSRRAPLRAGGPARPGRVPDRPGAHGRPVAGLSPGGARPAPGIRDRRRLPWTRIGRLVDRGREARPRRIADVAVGAWGPPAALPRIGTA